MMHETKGVKEQGRSEELGKGPGDGFDNGRNGNGRTDLEPSTRQGKPVSSHFCPDDVDPFDTVEWEQRTASIKDENGGVLFEQTDCEIPSDWSPLATNVVVSKYFYGEPGTPERETSARQVIHRVARTIADWGVADGYFAGEEDGERFYRDLAWMCLHQHGAFNSPVWFNVGLYHQYGVGGSRGNYRFDTETKSIRRPETS
ncbi:MAG: vitamin B12-dependent ribonucleotide reductase, partial [Planctomycetaceae bacterium]